MPQAHQAAGIRIRGETDGLVFEGNTIRDTRQTASQSQATGILVEQRVGDVILRDNQIKAAKLIDDRRAVKEATGSKNSD